MLTEAIAQFDEINRQDPRRQLFQGQEVPRELIFSQRVTFWLNQLQPNPSEVVQLAARSHTVCRWEVPRDRYERNTVGYHEWRRKTAEHSAATATRILTELGFPEKVRKRVVDLITRVLPAKEAEAQLLEDADCLAFCEIKFEVYARQWDQDKLRRILKGTWSKMSPAARRMSDQLSIAPRLKQLLEG